MRPKKKKMTHNILALICLLFALIACKTQPKELPTAIKGYPIDSTLQVVSQLPAIVDESSGIINWNNSIWTHNDSKKEAALYEVNPADGALKNTVTIANLKNIDWEEIAQDAQYVYIGDFGNNKGKRKNLMIYKIAKQAIETGKVERVDTIAFAYPDQTDFTGPKHDHNFDCEAMIVVKDSIYLFSKNFRDKHSKLYSLPTNPGQYTAQLKDRFNVKGNITGADLNEDGTVALCGYYFDEGTFLPFVWLLWDYPAQSFFKGKKQRVNFSIFSQIEGICYDKEDQFYISSESTMLTKGQLYRFDAKKWMK